MWYRPKHPDARRALHVRHSLGFFIHRREYERFLDEARIRHPEHNEHENAAWAAHCAHTHPDAKSPNEHHLIAAIVALILYLFTVHVAKGAPPEPRVVSNGAYWRTLKMTPPNFLGQIYGGPVTARMQIRSGGAWVDVDASTGLPITCLSGCGGAASFTDNAAFTAGTTSVNNISGVFNDGISSLTSGSAGAIRSTSDRMLFVNLGKLGGTALTGANVVDGGNTAFRVNCVVGCGAGSTTPTDAFANPTTASLAFSFLAGWNGSTWDRLKSTTANGLTVDVTRVQGTVGVTQSTSPWVVSGTVTTTPPSNASTNVAQWAGNTLGTTSNYGTSPGAVAVPGVNAFITNTPAVTLTSTTITGTVAATESGTWTVQPGNTANTTAWKVDGSAVTQPVSLTSTTITGTVAATQSGTWTDRVVGNAGAAFDAANNAAAPANVVAQGVEVIAQGSQPTAATAGNIRRSLATTEGVMFVQEGNSNRFSCFIQAVTVTTQCQAAPGAGLRAYVTSAMMSNQAATVQTLDVVFGTGTNCATGTTALTHKIQMGTNATTTSPMFVPMQFQTPLIPTAANAICIRPSAATAFGATLTGFIAP